MVSRLKSGHECDRQTDRRPGENNISPNPKGGRHNDYYESESLSNQPNLFPVEIHLFFFDVIAL